MANDKLLGRQYTFAVTPFPMFDTKGKILDVSEFLHDATRVRQGKTDYKNFVSMYIHDLKNYKILSRGFLGRLKSEKVGSMAEKQMKYAYFINSDLESPEKLVLDFLDFSRFDITAYYPSLSAFDIIKLLEKISQSVSVQTEKKKIPIVSKWPNQKINVEADQMLFERLVNNLLNNAIKYSHENDNVIVRCKERVRKETLDIINTGPVIKKNHLSCLFDAFHQAKGGEGSGLGLAIAKRIADLHGGKISSGTTSRRHEIFTFTIHQRQSILKRDQEKKELGYER